MLGIEIHTSLAKLIQYKNTTVEYSYVVLTERLFD